jgi:hypothetical protein
MSREVIYKKDNIPSTYLPVKPMKKVYKDCYCNPGFLVTPPYKIQILYINTSSLESSWILCCTNKPWL